MVKKQSVSKCVRKRGGKELGSVPTENFLVLKIKNIPNKQIKLLKSAIDSAVQQYLATDDEKLPEQ